jgi:hypothetical protein
VKVKPMRRRARWRGKFIKTSLLEDDFSKKLYQGSVFKNRSDDNR